MAKKSKKEKKNSERSELKILLSDELMGSKCSDKYIKYISASEMNLKEARHLLKKELKANVDKKVSVLMSVGSYHATAKFNEWRESSVQGNERRLFGDALSGFKRELVMIERLGEKYECKIVMASLIPLPDHQDMKSDKEAVTHMASKLFVAANEEINCYSRKIGIDALVLKKFCDCGNKNKYITGQRKINLKKYKDGKPNKDLKRKLMSQAVNRLRAM